VNREKLEQTLRKVIEDRNARSLGERSEVYSAARASLRKATNEDPAVLADVDEAIEGIETAYAPRPAVEEKGGKKQGGAKAALSGLVSGAILGGLATAAVMVFGFRFQPADPISVKLMQQYEATAPLVPAAVDYLHKVRDAVVAMQKSDPVALEAKASKHFIPVSQLDPALWKQFPKSMPPGTSVILRADNKNYKIAFNWTLCGAVRVSMPEMVNLGNSIQNTLGCQYFGIWTKDASNW
jgi:hypothetical protein